MWVPSVKTMFLILSRKIHGSHCSATIVVRSLKLNIRFRVNLEEANSAQLILNRNSSANATTPPCKYLLIYVLFIAFVNIKKCFFLFLSSLSLFI